MFSKIHGRFNGRGGKVRLTFAALICAAGLGLGTEGTTVLAQLTVGNPKPALEWNGMYNCPANTSCEAVPCPHPSATDSCGTYVQSLFIGSICQPNNGGADSSCSYIGSPTVCSQVYNCNYYPEDGSCAPSGSATGAYSWGQAVNCS